MIVARSEVKQEGKALLAQGPADSILEEAIVARADVKQEGKVLLGQGLFYRILEEVDRCECRREAGGQSSPCPRARPTAAWRK